MARTKKMSRANSSLSKASSSGHAKTMDGSSPRPSQERVGNYDMGGLHKKWDNDENIRARIRSGYHLCRHFDVEKKVETDDYVEACVEDTRANKFVIAPVLELMRVHGGLLPSIDGLIQSIDLFYQITTVSKGLEHSYQQAWAIRRSIQIVKSFAYKDQPPQDCRPVA